MECTIFNEECKKQVINDKQCDKCISRRQILTLLDIQDKLKSIESSLKCSTEDKTKRKNK